MSAIVNHVIDGPHGPILVDACFAKKKAPVVVFAHGFKGFKDWGHFPIVAERMAASGLNFVKFNFSHNGTTVDDPSAFGDLEAFGNNNLCIELDDLGAVMDWALAQKSVNGNLYLSGHSRGGGTAILKAAEDSRVKKLVTWAAVHDLEAWITRAGLETWRNDGVIYFPNSRTGQNMPLYYQMYENFVHNRTRLAIPRNAPNITVPCLFIHGVADETVPMQAAQQLRSWVPGAEMILIPEAGHTFSVGHPFNGQELPEQAEQVLTATIAFFQEK